MLGKLTRCWQDWSIRNIRLIYNERQLTATLDTDLSIPVNLQTFSYSTLMWNRQRGYKSFKNLKVKKYAYPTEIRKQKYEGEAETWKCARTSLQRDVQKKGKSSILSGIYLRIHWITQNSFTFCLDSAYLYRFHGLTLSDRIFPPTNHKRRED